MPMCAVGRGTRFARNAGMTSTDPLVCALGSVAAGVLLFQAPVASACDPEPICTPVRLLGEDALVPANLVHFRVNTVSPGPLVLRTAAGDPIETSIQTLGEHQVFAPVEPVPAGTEVELQYNSACQPETSLQYRFRTSEPKVMELREARLVLEGHDRMPPDAAGPHEMITRVRYEGPSENGAADHLTDVIVRVDGKQTELSDGPGGRFVVIHTPCNPTIGEVVADACGNLDKVPEGSRRVEVEPRVVGQAPLPAAVLDIEISCQQPDPSAEPPTPEANTAAGTEQPTPASTTEQPTPASTADSSGSPDASSQATAPNRGVQGVAGSGASESSNPQPHSAQHAAPPIGAPEHSTGTSDSGCTASGPVTGNTTWMAVLGGAVALLHLKRRHRSLSRRTPARPRDQTWLKR